MIRPEIRAMSGYVPGEQPRQADIIKLNTNENPYPPSPRVFETLRDHLTGDKLRKYPDPVGTAFRHAAAQVLGVDPEALVIGNGSDDLLTILTRACVPQGGLIVSPTPSYLLYKTLASIQGAEFQTVPFTADWQLPHPWPFPHAHVTFLANPNSPSGTLVDAEALERLASSLTGILVIDEAYADFARCNALSMLAHRNVIVTRTLSKSYALAGIRFGFAIAHPELVIELNKVKDSYNCDVLSLAAAEAALLDQSHFRATRERILQSRERLQKELTRRDFAVTPSEANFLWCRHRTIAPKPIYLELKARGILVRYMCYDSFGDGLRITVGREDEIDRLLAALDATLPMLAAQHASLGTP